MPLINTKALTSMLRAETGTTLVADLGVVDEGMMGYSKCSVSTGIEHWQGMYFVWISVTPTKGRAGRYTRVIKWPYGRNAAAELHAVIADLRVVESIVVSGRLPDRRGGFARLLDALIRRHHLGEHRFDSSLTDDTLYGSTVSAAVSRMGGGQLEISLTENRRSGGTILAQFPHSSCARIRQALQTYATHART